MLKTATVLSLALFLAPPLLPAAQASPLGLTPRETYALMRERGDEVLFIDVRDPVEIMFVGFTDVLDANIPFVLVNRDVWDEENNRFRLDPNPRFAQQVRQALEAKGLDESATVPHVPLRQ